MIPSLSTGFLQTTARMPERPALWVGGAFVSYADLRDDALRIAATLQRFVPPYAPPLTAVFAERSRCGFGGILGALLAGHGYVPLNVTYPIARTRRMLEHAGCTAIVVDAEAEAHLTQLVADSTRALVIVLPERFAQYLPG